MHYERVKGIVLAHRVSVLIVLVGILVVLALGWIGWKIGSQKRASRLRESAATRVTSGPNQASVVRGTPTQPPAGIDDGTTPSIPILPPINSNMPQMFLDLLTVFPGESAKLLGSRPDQSYTITKMPQRDVWSVQERRPSARPVLYETWGDLCVGIAKATEMWPFVSMTFPSGKTYLVQKKSPPRDIGAASGEPWLGGTYFDQAYVNRPPRVFDR